MPDLAVSSALRWTQSYKFPQRVPPSRTIGINVNLRAILWVPLIHPPSNRKNWGYRPQTGLFLVSFPSRSLTKATSALGMWC